jgi:hypothetical protein
MVVSLERRLHAFHGATLAALASFTGDGEAVLEVPGVDYVPGAPVRVRVRRRGIRYDLDDLGGAVEAAGRPAGWRDAAQAVVDDASLNLARRTGAVFVPAVEGRDIAALVVRVADTSLGVHRAVLELDG